MAHMIAELFPLEYFKCMGPLERLHTFIIQRTFPKAFLNQSRFSNIRFLNKLLLNSAQTFSPAGIWKNIRIISLNNSCNSTFLWGWAE